LGYAYESLDFISHLKEGDTLKESIQNFKTDTRRYKLGVKLGYAFFFIFTTNFRKFPETGAQLN
ncbi:MAG: hypothetical protein KDD45_08620, partial [Bdellovibrionales bacterium]|nr:hypothetical protein [Bdellovibrionales bacterium]